MFIKNKMLMLLRRFNKKNVYFLEEYKKVKKDAYIKKNMDISTKSNNIIITPFKFDNSHGFEAIYSRKAILEGLNVYAFLCGQGVSKCEKIGVFENLKKTRCELCFFEQLDFTKQFGVIPCYVKKEITTTDKDTMNDTINGFFQNDFNSTFLGVNLKKILKSALQRYYLEAEPSMDDNNVTRGFLKTILSTLIAFDKLCQRVNPIYVLSSHGTYSTWGSIIEYCRAKNIPVIVWGRVYNKWGIYFANNESYLTERASRSDIDWKKKELTNEQKEIIINFLEMRTGKKGSSFLFDYNKNHKDQLDREEICIRLDIPRDAMIVGLFPNIPWDGSVTGVSEAFSSYLEWLATTIEYFEKRKDIYLLIRTHPAEKADGALIGKENLSSLLNQIREVLPKNVIVLPADSEINSFAVGKASTFGIFYCSTVGVELTYLGVPLVCAGPSPLKNKGIVFDAQSKKEYLDLLERGVRRELVVTDEKKDRLLKFSYYDMFTRVMPEHFLEFDNNGGLKKLLFDSENEVKNNEVLDHLFKTINGKTKYDFEKFY